jgi:hypothetical protein
MDKGPYEVRSPLDDTDDINDKPIETSVRPTPVAQAITETEPVAASISIH